MATAADRVQLHGHGASGVGDVLHERAVADAISQGRCTRRIALGARGPARERGGNREHAAPPGERDEPVLGPVHGNDGQGAAAAAPAVEPRGHSSRDDADRTDSARRLTGEPVAHHRTVRDAGREDALRVDSETPPQGIGEGLQKRDVVPTLTARTSIEPAPIPGGRIGDDESFGVGKTVESGMRGDAGGGAAAPVQDHHDRIRLPAGVGGHVDQVPSLDFPHTHPLRLRRSLGGSQRERQAEHRRDDLIFHHMPTIADLRREYARARLDEQDLAADPFLMFAAWFAQAVETALPEPNAMTLATAAPDRTPSARIVLLKAVDASGFVFFTDYRSRKAAELTANPRAALVFHWQELERQVRVVGGVERIPEPESDAYYRTRPLGSRIGAWASEQSAVLPSRAELEARLAAIEARHPDGNVPRPSHWGGFRVSPVEVEFWQGRESRLHDRLRYRRSDMQARWIVERLSP